MACNQTIIIIYSVQYPVSNSCTNSYYAATETGVDTRLCLGKIYVYVSPGKTNLGKFH